MTSEDEPGCPQCEDTGVYDQGQDDGCGENWVLCDCVTAEPESDAENTSYPDGVTGEG